MPDSTELLDTALPAEDPMDTPVAEPVPEPAPAPDEKKHTLLPYLVLGLMFLAGIVVFFLR